MASVIDEVSAVNKAFDELVAGVIAAILPFVETILDALSNLARALEPMTPNRSRAYPGSDAVYARRGKSRARG